MITADMTVAQALATARERLASSPTADLDARVLLEGVTGEDRAALIAKDGEPIGDHAVAYEAAIARREEGEPVAYITERQEFFGLSFVVGHGVLIPRPESEMLVEAAIAAAPRRILDLGTGSGSLLIASLDALPEAQGAGIDASGEAIAIAFENSETLIGDERAQWFQARFDEAAQLFEGETFDVILANPPYIADGTELPPSVVNFEPATALFSGSDGLTAHRDVAAVIRELLSPGGSAYIEIGSDQGAQAMDLYRAALADRDVALQQDAAGLDRMVAITPRPGL
ncbi:MAG: peptide chain release factor N(5)-glutamine methyltransferase [Pseudomonadota bacterium]